MEYDAESSDLLGAGVFLRHGDGPPVFYEVAGLRAHHGSLLLRLVSILDRTAAENLRGRDVLIPKDRLPQEGGGIYIYQLMGLTVTALDENGAWSVWGTISAVDGRTGQELWTISREGEADILFPADEKLVLGFDLERNRVRIAPPPGLIDLYRS